MKTTTIALLAATVAAFAMPVFGQGAEKFELTDEERARIEAKATQLFETAQKLDETQRKLEAVRARIREKFAPTLNDELEAMKNDVLKKRGEAVAKLNAY